jgi:hypothetical protein
MAPYLKLLGGDDPLNTDGLERWLMEHVASFDELSGFKHPGDGSAVGAIADKLIASLPP